MTDSAPDHDGPAPATVTPSWATLRASVSYEDEAVLALNKPAGISVLGERHDTDLVRLAAAAGETLYPVHRIDKVTSGLLLLAKDLSIHGPLTRQFAMRTVIKRYLAVVRPGGLGPSGLIDLPLSTGRKGRIRIAADRAAIRTEERTGEPYARQWSVPADAIFDQVKTYPSTTSFQTLADNGDEAVLALSPHTGRRHQLRVQLAWIGHPIVGDPLFAARGTTKPRTGLHSWQLEIDLPWRNDYRLQLRADPGSDFWRLTRLDTPVLGLSQSSD